MKSDLSIDFGDNIQLYKSWMRNIDLNGDGVLDIFFKLNNMPYSGTRANLSIGNIVEYLDGRCVKSNKLKATAIALPGELI